MVYFVDNIFFNLFNKTQSPKLKLNEFVIGVKSKQLPKIN